MIKKIKRFKNRASSYYYFDGALGMLLGLMRILLYKLSDRQKRRKWKTILASKDTEISVHIGDVRLLLNREDEGLSAELAVDGVHEPAATSYLLKMIEPGMTIVDIGANLGYYALQEAKNVLPGGKVIAFEPSPDSFSILKRNVELNGIKNIQLKQLAVSDKNEIVEFHISSRANVSRIGSRDDSTTILHVEAVRLDDLLCSEQRIDLIRMDIEGHEVEAIKGMLDILDRHHPELFIEVHFPILGDKGIKEMFETLRTFGYKANCLIFRSADMKYFGSFLCNKNKICKFINLNSIEERLKDETSVIFFSRDP